MTKTNGGVDDELSLQLRKEAEQVLHDEPELCPLLAQTVLANTVESFEDAVAQTVCYRLLLQPCSKQNNNSGGSVMFCPFKLKELIRDSMDSDMLEMGHTMKHSIREDALAVCRRDPAMDTILEVVLFSKGYAALVCHRAAFRLWNKRKFTALFLQSQCSAVFGLDLHPKSRIGAGIMLDHGTGVVIGETATIGDGCTLLHSVTLGGTGKDHGDRHPKVGKNVLIGAGASLLGNITIGDGAKIGAGSVVLRAIPAHATAVGAPAKIIGRSVESKPGSDIDETLESVSLLHKSISGVTQSTEPITDDESDSSGSNGVCPYREYSRLAKLAPKDAITICTLHKILSPLGCSMNEIGSSLFALDERNVGYVHRDAFAQHGVDIIVEQTTLERPTVDRAVTAYLESGAFMPNPADYDIGMQLE